MNTTTTMAKDLSSRPQKHWSKQFWPWFVILLPTCGVIASLFTIVLAVQNAPTITDRDIGRFNRTETPEAPIIVPASSTEQKTH